MDDWRDLWVHVLSIGTETGKHPHLRSEILFLKFRCWDFDQELVLISPAVESAPTNETILSPGYETGTGVPQTHVPWMIGHSRWKIYSVDGWIIIRHFC